MIDIHQKHIWPLGKKTFEGHVLLITAVSNKLKQVNIYSHLQHFVLFVTYFQYIWNIFQIAAYFD